MLQKHIHPTFLHINVKIQWTAMPSSHVTTTVPTTNMTLKCDLNAAYENEFMCRYQTAMSIYRPNMYSLQSKVLPGLLV